MAVSVEMLVKKYPELKDFEADQLQMVIDDAANSVSRRVWGKLYVQGICALAAHLFYSKGGFDDGGDGQPARIVTGQSAAALSESFAVVSSTSDSDKIYETSSYGQEYLRLRRSIRRHILVT